MPLENMVTIITGGAQGIGYAIAERFLRDKAKVIIADIDNKAGKAAESALPLALQRRSGKSPIQPMLSGARMAATSFNSSRNHWISWSVFG